MTTLKEKIGCWANERWRTELALMRSARSDWLELCNRNERLERDEVSDGRICKWRDSSRLTVARVFPDVGRRLLLHAFRQWPLNLNEGSSRLASSQVEASACLAIGGVDRLPQFMAVLASLRGQSHDAMELIVVEQSESPCLAQLLPEDVVYLHDAQEPGTEFNKSRALNLAAMKARGKYLLIHDADYVVPRDYVRECCRVLQQVHGVRPSRLNFHLEHDSTFRLIETKRVTADLVPEYIVQNNPTPMAVRTESYSQIGGHDESFVGWGGEDVEFLSRLRTLSVAEGGWLPTIHLWHPPAPRKASGHRNQQQQDQKLAIDPHLRIDELRRVKEKQ